MSVYSSYIQVKHTIGSVYDLRFELIVDGIQILHFAWTKLSNNVTVVHNLPAVCTPLYTIPGASLASVEVSLTV